MMFARALAMLCIASLLASCGLVTHLARGQQLKQLETAYAAERADCEKRFPAKKPAAPRVRCRNDALIKRNAAMEQLPGHVRISDLARLASARYVLAAERYDAGRLSDAEYDLEVAAAENEYSTRWHDRVNGVTMATAAENQAAAARQQAIQSAIPKSVTCNRLGNTVTCN